MSHSVWIAFFSYMVVTALSPGPNNILALHSTGSLGWQRSRKLLWGIYTGFLVVIAVCGMFSVFLIEVLPSLSAYLNYAGAAYIVWLAWHVAGSKPLEAAEISISPSFWRGFLLQFLNVKIILTGITVFTSFVLPSYDSFMAIAGFILLTALIGNGATHVWAVAGSAFSSFLQKYWRIANIVMAALLLYSAVKLIL
ncbi:LysE family transporter [Paenibacillus sp. NPDC058071]|uniref:LysE family transporter n=1 Tax=Paenibacillus sp. NPDC058071 TaxID=3346326 RepID=UPI0036D7CCC3